MGAPLALVPPKPARKTPEQLLAARVDRQRERARKSARNRVRMGDTYKNKKTGKIENRAAIDEIHNSLMLYDQTLGLSAANYRLLHKLAGIWADKHTLKGFPSLAAIADMCGTNRVHVWRRLHELEKLGYLRLKSRGERRSLEFDLTPLRDRLRTFREPERALLNGELTDKE